MNSVQWEMNNVNQRETFDQILLAIDNLFLDQCLKGEKSCKELETEIVTKV